VAVADPVADMDTDARVDDVDGPATGVRGEAERSAATPLDGPASTDGGPETAAAVAVGAGLFLRFRGFGGFSGPYPH